jgi:hypothetical protein
LGHAAASHRDANLLHIHIPTTTGGLFRPRASVAKLSAAATFFTFSHFSPSSIYLKLFFQSFICNYSATTINLTGTFRGKACLQVISETDGKASAGQVLRSLNSHVYFNILESGQFADHRGGSLQ